MNPNGLYFFQIWERELEEPSANFWGRRYTQSDSLVNEALYWDQVGNWYYSYIDRPLSIDWEQLVVDVKSESLHWGHGIEGLLADMQDWLEVMAPNGELPPILSGYATVSVDTRDPRVVEEVESLLQRLRKAKKGQR